jgi:hypothetical protein
MGLNVVAHCILQGWTPTAVQRDGTQGDKTAVNNIIDSCIMYYYNDHEIDGIGK